MSDRRPPDPHHHTVAPAISDTRLALALSAGENSDLCSGCVRCCTYITVEIDAPRAAWEYDQWIWALHHRGIELYLESPEHWYLHVETRCDQLNAQRRCAIHGRHPVLCREYDPRSCERRLPLADIRAWFKTGADLEAWLGRERPAHHRRLMAYRRDALQGPAVANARAAGASAIPLLQIAAPSAVIARSAPARLRGAAGSRRPNLR